jgi:sulfur-oxidizing protein SoxY
VRKAIVTIAMLAAWQGTAWAAPAYPKDPLGSPMWEAHARTLFGDDPVRFDDRVHVVFPEIAENQRVFPVVVDARGISGVARIVLFADLNPIPVAVDYRPTAAAPYLAARIKLDQRTPVRGAVQLTDGSWLVSGGWIDAAGGGCSAPPVSRVRGDWAQHLGEMRGEALTDGKDSRLHLTFRHPMDTGLVENIATYYIETLSVKNAAGKPYGDMDIWASVSEDPAFTILPVAAPGETLVIDARDTNGRDYGGRVTVGQSSAGKMAAN